MTTYPIEANVSWHELMANIVPFAEQMAHPSKKEIIVSEYDAERLELAAKIIRARLVAPTK